MATETKVVEQRIIQRLINTIADYEEGGKLYSQVIPLHTQAYAIYDKQGKVGLYYVFGDGVHTYTEIRDGQSSVESAHEYAVFDDAWINLINSKADLQYMNFELAKRQYISNLINEITEENEKSTTLYPSVKAVTTLADILQDNIDQEASDRNAADSSLQDALSDETNARTAADTTLQNNINSEETARINADNDLSDAIEQEGAARAQKDLELSQDINDEITARQNADIALNVSIENEETRAKDAEDQLAADITAENTRAVNAEEALDTAKADKSNVYTKAEIDAKLTSAMRFKGTKPTYNDLPKSGNEVGDMWNILADGTNYAWDGNAWDKLSETIDLSPFATKEEVSAVDEGLQDNIDAEANTREANDS